MATAQSAWDAVWAVEEGEINANVGRLMAYHATGGGKEGVAGPTDLAVRASSPSSMRLSVQPGAVSMKCRAENQRYQSYVGSLPKVDYVDLQATTTSARSDLIVAEVQNPYLPGEDFPEPPDADKYLEKYIKTVVWPNVGPGVTEAWQVDPTASAYAISRADLPKNCQAVAPTMLKDLRRASNTNPPDASSIFMDVKELFTTIVLPQSGTLDRLDKRVWPDSAFWDIYVPPWATSAEAYITFNPRTEFGNTYGCLWAEWNGRLGGGQVFDVNLKDDFWNLCDAGGIRQPMVAGGAWQIPPEERGTYRRLRIRADTYGIAAGNAKGQTRCPTGTLANCQVVFKQVPSSL